MDYQGNYFPDEPDEHQSKTLKNIKSIFKWTMYGISFVIYAVIFYILFINRDSKVLEKNYIHTVEQYEGIEIDSMDLYRINTRIFMNDDGSIQVHNVDYSHRYSTMEIGIKYNAKKNTDNLREDALEYILTDAHGRQYDIVNIEEASRGRYGFSRIAFEGLNIDLDSNDLRYDIEKPAKVRSNEEYTLTVIRKSDKSVLFEFIIYDNSTTFNKTEYNN